MTQSNFNIRLHPTGNELEAGPRNTESSNLPQSRNNDRQSLTRSQSFFDQMERARYNAFTRGSRQTANASAPNRQAMNFVNSL